MRGRMACAGWVVLLLLPVALPRVSAAAPEQAEASPSLSELQAAVERDPGNPDLHVDLGLAYWQRDDLTRALETFRRAVEVGPESANAHNWLGVALSGKSDLPGAIAAFRRAIALDPEYGRAYTNLGSTLATSGDYTEAVAVFQKALALEPNPLAAHMNLGLALRELGEFDAAVLHLRRVVEEDPTNALIHYELGQTLRQSGDLVGAIAALEQAITVNPELREGYYALGVTLRQRSAAAARQRPSRPPSPADAAYQRAQEAATQGDLGLARERLGEALGLDAEHGPAHSLLGFVLGQQEDLSAALDHLDRAVALQPESADARYNLGAALWFSGARQRAVSELRQSVALDPAAGAGYALLGVALRETGDLAAAGASLQRAIALMPPTAALYVDLGITYLRVGDLDKALGQLEAGLNLPAPSRPVPDWGAAAAALRQALAGNPGRADAHNVQGRLLGRLGVESDAVAAEFRAAVRLRPDYAEAHNNLGLVLIQAGDDEAGIAALREAVRIAPDYAEARGNLGAALTPTDAETAVRELEKAVALAPGSAKAHFNLAAAYGAAPSAGREKEIAQLRKVIELAPTFARAHLALGKALLREGAVGDAIAALEEAARLDPERGEAQYQLGLALARAGRKEDATAALDKGRALVEVEERDRIASLDLAQGRSALEQGDLELAAAKLRHALKLRPDSFEAQRLLGAVLEGQGDATGAASAYRKALERNPADPLAKQGLERLTRREPAADDPGSIAALEAYFRDGRFEEVEPRLSEYVERYPESAWGWYALGYSLYTQQKVGAAIQALSRSLVLDIANAEAHKLLGRALMVIGRYDAAQLEFEQALGYHPEVPAEIHYNLGKLFSIQDTWEPARKHFEAALALDPGYIEALDGLGFALEALDDDAGAVATYEKAIALNEARGGRFASAHANLSAYYNRAGDPEKALAYARQALELDPESDHAWFQQARALERQGSLVEAVAALGRAIALNGRSSSYYYVLAGLQRRLGNAEASREALESFRRLQRETDELDERRREIRGGKRAAGSDG